MDAIRSDSSTLSELSSCSVFENKESTANGFVDVILSELPFVVFFVSATNLYFTSNSADNDDSLPRLWFFLNLVSGSISTGRSLCRPLPSQRIS